MTSVKILPYRPPARLIRANEKICVKDVLNFMDSELSSQFCARAKLQARVVQRMDNAIHRINHYPADSVVCFVNTYPLDSVIQPLNNRGQVILIITQSRKNCPIIAPSRACA